MKACMPYKGAAGSRNLLASNLSFGLYMHHVRRKNYVPVNGRHIKYATCTTPYANLTFDLHEINRLLPTNTHLRLALLSQNEHQLIHTADLCLSLGTPAASATSPA